MKSFKLFLLQCFLIGSLIACQKQKEEQPNKVDVMVNELINSRKMAGASIAMLKNDKLVFKNNYGFADIDNKIKVNDSTQFNVMSITKNFIACGLMQLANDKKVDLDAPITQYLNNLPNEYKNVLVYQLLNHSSGVPDYVEVPGYLAQANQMQSPIQVLGPILEKPLAFIPGEKNEYSNSAYFLAGLLIEKISGLALQEYLKQNIFEPLQMNNTYLQVNNDISVSKAKGYRSIEGKLKKEKHLDPSQYWAAGAVVSSINDMIIWDKALKNGSLLPVNVINQMMQATLLNNGSMSEYGLGFELMNTSEMKIVGETGAGLGFNAANLEFENDSLTVIVLTNTTSTNSAMLAKDLRDMMTSSSSKNNPISTAQEKDTLDMKVLNVFKELQDNKVDENNFINKEVSKSFKYDNFDYAKRKGKLIDVLRKGEKLNPENIVRKYQITFENDTVMWVIIFSKDGKIAITNHLF